MYLELYWRQTLKHSIRNGKCVVCSYIVTFLFTESLLFLECPDFLRHNV